MKIRLLRRQDISSACRIIQQNYSVRFAKQARLELLEMFGRSPIKPRYVVATIDNKIVGLAGFTQAWMDYSVYEIFWVNVAPAYQKQGIGSALIRHVINQIKRKKPRIVLLTTTLPKIYSREFKFKLLSHLTNGYWLMGSKGLAR